MSEQQVKNHLKNNTDILIKNGTNVVDDVVKSGDNVIKELNSIDNIFDMYPGTASKIPDTNFSTGRKTWNNLDEQLAMQKVFADPLDGATEIYKPGTLGYTRLPGGPEQWAKYEKKVGGIIFTLIIIQLLANF